MGQNLALVCIVALIVGACTAPAIVERWRPDPTTECVKRAWTQADRIECLRAKPQTGGG